MNRNQLRAEQRKQNKPIKQENNDKWFNELPMDKKFYLTKYIDKKLEKIHQDTTEIMDSCYIGAMIETLELDLDTCIEIARKANLNMHETQKILDKMRGEYFMKVNNVELRKKIKESAKEKLNKNPKKSTLDITRELEKIYNLPPKDLHILVAEARKELKYEKANNAENVKINIPASEQEKQAFLNEITKKEVAPEKESKTVIKSIVENANSKSTIEHKESGEIVFKVESKQKLKVKNVIQEIEGEYGTYTKSSEGVKTYDKLYKDIKHVNEEKEATMRRLDNKEHDIKNQIEELTKQLSTLSENKNREMSKYSEIIEVFRM